MTSQLNELGRMQLEKSCLLMGTASQGNLFLFRSVREILTLYKHPDLSGSV